MVLVVLLTFTGPALGWLGCFFDSPVLFWTGVSVAIVNLTMNLLSGAMRLPILPGMFIGAGYLLYGRDEVGAALGLLAWTTLESAGEIASLLGGRHRSARSRLGRDRWD